MEGLTIPMAEVYTGRGKNYHIIWTGLLASQGGRSEVPVVAKRGGQMVVGIGGREANVLNSAAFLRRGWTLCAPKLK